jgi:hypothetical protein
MPFNFYEPDRLDTSLMDLGPTINLMSNVRLVELKRYSWGMSQPTHTPATILAPNLRPAKFFMNSC